MDSENKALPKKRKAPPHAFKPGQSGNPGGRPKTSTELRLKLATISGTAVEKLLEILTDEKTNNKDRLTAIKLCLEFVLPKPTEPIQQDQSAISRLADILSGKEDTKPPEET
jgi:hypothetical protein